MPFLLVQCHCVNHVKDFILSLFGGDGVYIGDIDVVLFQCVAEEFFQLFVDIFHVITGFTDKERIGISCNIFPFLRILPSIQRERVVSF